MICFLNEDELYDIHHRIITVYSDGLYAMENNVQVMNMIPERS